MKAALSVRVAWDPNPETNIQGYRLYHGQVGAGLTNMVDVGNQTTGTVTNLALSKSYFFYVTAYNTFGLESDPSEILTYQTPPPFSLEMDSQLIVLAPSEITLRPRVAGYRPPGSELLVSWRETSASGSPIQESGTLTPRVTVATPGSYGFELTVIADGAQFVTATTVLAIDGTVDPGRTDPIILSYLPIPLDDVIYFQWNARGDRSYALAYTRNFGDRTWVPVTLFYPGYSDHFLSKSWMAGLGSVFFSVFERP